MTTKRETILAAIRTALTNTTGVGTRIYRSRVVPLSRSESPAIVVEPLTDIANNGVLPKLDWTMTVLISVIVRGDPADQLADPIVEDIHTKLIANQPLHALISGLVPTRVSFNMVEADQDAGVVSLEYEVRYRTSYTNLSVS
jgi:hypothetical protein